VLCKIFLISQDKYLLNEPVGIGLIFNGRIKGHTNTRFVHAMNALWAEGLISCDLSILKRRDNFHATIAILVTI
jgi:hypothetical protein